MTGHDRQTQRQTQPIVKDVVVYVSIYSYFTSILDELFSAKKVENVF